MNTKFGILQQLWLMFKCIPVLGLLPFYKCNKLVHAKWYRYSLLMCCVVILILGVYLRVRHESMNLRHMDIALILFLIVLSISSSPKHTNQFYSYFDEFDWLLCRNHNVPRPTDKFVNCKFASLQILTILSSAMNIVLYMYVWRGWVAIFLSTLTTFYIGNIYIVQVLLIGVILNKFDGLCLAVDVCQSYHVKSMCELHWILCELVHEFNNIFGWQLLLQTIITCFAISKTLDYMLFLCSDAIVTTCIVFRLFHLMVLFIYLVTQTSKVGKLFTILSRKADRLLYKESRNLKFSDSLKAFSEQAKERPIVTAASFFAFDYTLIITLFALLSTFLILIVQSK